MEKSKKLTADEIVAMLSVGSDDFLAFDMIEHAPSRMPDVCAMLRLEAICPNGRCQNGVSWVAHDIFYLRWDADDLAGKATEADIIYLRRCGVMYSDGCLAMFV